MLAGEGSPVPTKPARPREFPFWPTRFPTSEAYPAIAGRFEPRLGWVATEVELHGILMPTPAVRLRWPFRGTWGPLRSKAGGAAVGRPRKYATEEERRNVVRQRQRKYHNTHHKALSARRAKAWAEGDLGRDMKTPAPVLRGDGAGAGAGVEPITGTFGTRGEMGQHQCRNNALN
jgi:hypothetical protein